MNKTTLFICKSCHRSSEEVPKNQPCDGTILLDKINDINDKNSSIELEIQPVGCLWACSRGCVVAVSSPKKPTWIFIDIKVDEKVDENTKALLEFTQLYNNSHKGNIPWEKIPEPLQSAIFAQIPSVLNYENLD
ncbi:DUF1636 family protein [Calothrix sp. UHCC 0171]|uniref:DUF1636 family protein n=1 Tax=Calothrix sp. UHCC 0171 TaxID=3110245 RepID=UPI002B21251F|nr:DUF1636 family protein [Calothrix sp. UHCC 0171]MEA5574045.1 DUF1636 family protein [Calothrix sp. UHCC 0171]